MSHHAPFKSLAPIDWESVPGSEEDLAQFLRSTFADAQTIIDSIPLPNGVASAIHGAGSSGHGRARAKTDPSGGSVALNRALSPGDDTRTGACAQTAKLLHKEWKEVKTNPRDNPLAINVYKLSAKDGKGAWFARRGIHEGVPFDKFRLGLEREFSEALKARAKNPDAGPGAGNVRGIGAERRAESTDAEGIGKLEVYQLSAQFPGPTTPRDFITLLLTSAPEPPAGGSKKKGRARPAPRQFMIVSKPCVHPGCGPRQGFIRGQYESVEIIREIPVEVPLRKVRSSIDLNKDDAGDPSRAEQAAIGREAIIRSARKATAGGVDGQDDDDDDDDDARSVRSDVGTIKDVDASMRSGHETEMAVEWLMVTRSDPGGSVPRFMVEKGTPAGIVSDAGRLLDWLASKSLEDLADEPGLDSTAAEAAAGTLGVGEEGSRSDAQQLHGSTTENDASKPRVSKKPEAPIRNLVPNPQAQTNDVPPVASASGLYSMITGAIGVAGSAVASRIPFGGSMRATDSDPDLDIGDDDTAAEDSSEVSSVRSFNSAMESPEQQPSEEIPSVNGTSATTENGETDTLKKVPSSYSRESEPSNAPSKASLQHDNDLKKLHERRRKIQDKMTKLQERSLSKQQEDRQKDEQAMAKLRDKHERELARQEEKYQRELRKIEERRLAEEKKAADRRRKQIEREDKANLALELEHARTELDVALKQVDLLKDQIGELQSQNTMLVATLGKHGLLKGGSIEALSDLKRSNSSASSRSMAVKS